MRTWPFFALLAALPYGCSSPAEGVHGPGGVYGGVFNFNETQVVRSLFPPSITLVSEQHIGSQVYEGLVRLDPRDLAVEPALAQSWAVDSSHTVYTFRLREGIRFHDDAAFPDGKGRELTAEDVAHCFTSICEAGSGDAAFHLFQGKVKGADAYHASGVQGGTVEGIRALDAHTVRIMLVQPFPGFLQSLAVAGCWIWPRELKAAYGDDLLRHAIGTGPFRLKAAQPAEAYVLERNPGYWEHDAEGRQLPYLDAVRITLVPEKDKEMAAFLKGRLSLVTELSLHSIRVLADSVDPQTGERRFNVLSIPALAVQFYGFNLSKPPFRDVRVRRAFALALDRSKLVDSVLHGLAVTAEHGLVAPGLAGYPYGQVPGIPFLPDSARKLLAAAGYPGGKGFPRVSLQVDDHGFGYRSVASMAQEMLGRELGVALSVSTVPTKTYYDRVERGEALFWREGWVADLPDPENFLALLYGKNAEPDTAKPSAFNTTRYADPRFDRLYALALTRDQLPARMADLAQAERIAMEDVPVIPLYHERYIMLSAPNVEGLSINPMELLDLRRVRLSADHSRRPATTS